eukprot:350946-Chlamydomonas_euryale.AAC.5
MPHPSSTMSLFALLSQRLAPRALSAQKAQIKVPWQQQCSLAQFSERLQYVMGIPKYRECKVETKHRERRGARSVA